MFTAQEKAQDLEKAQRKAQYLYEVSEDETLWPDDDISVTCPESLWQALTDVMMGIYCSPLRKETRELVFKALTFCNTISEEDD